MNIQFDSNISRSEAAGLVQLLTTLFPDLVSAPVNHLTPPPPPPSPEQLPEPELDGPVAGTALQQTATQPQSGLTLVQPSTEPATQRKRRTRAEIAADEAARKAHAETEANRVATEGHPEEAEAILAESNTVATTEPTRPPTVEDLRNLFNGYIQSHDFEDALAILNKFGCNRISEAAALEPAKLVQLAASLKGDASTPAIVPAEPVKTVAKEEFRDIAKAFVAKHGEPTAVAIFESFGCKVVSEALALEPAKFNELVEKLRG